MPCLDLTRRALWMVHSMPLTARPRTPTRHPPPADAYARLSAAYPGLRITLTDREPRSGAGWVRGDELAAGGAALEEYLACEAAQLAREHGRAPRPDVTASFGLHRYAWPACLLVTMPWFLTRRVPRPAAGDVAYHRAGLMEVRAGTFACLPGDPVAGLPGAVVAADEEALRAEVRSAIAALLDPVLAGFRPRTRRGPHALWATVCDEITEGLWYLGHLLGEEDRAVAELTALLPGGTPPFTAAAGFRAAGTAAAGGRGAARTRDRASCCLFYTLRPADTCATCPRTCEPATMRQAESPDAT